MGCSQNGSLSDRPTVRKTFLNKSCLSNCRHHFFILFFSCSKGSHTQSGSHKLIHTRSSVLVWYGAQTVMTVSGPCVIEVTETETGWGLSSPVSDRKLRRERLGGVTAEFIACSPSLRLSVCLSHLLPPLALNRYHLSFSYAFQSVSTFLSALSCLSTFSSLSFQTLLFIFSPPGWRVDEFCPFIPRVRHCSKKNNWSPINRV